MDALIVTVSLAASASPQTTARFAMRPVATMMLWGGFRMAWNQFDREGAEVRQRRASSLHLR